MSDKEHGHFGIAAVADLLLTTILRMQFWQLSCNIVDLSYYTCLLIITNSQKCLVCICRKQDGE